jgi:FkbM family methyltransferase
MKKKFFPPLGELYHFEAIETIYFVDEVITRRIYCGNNITISPGDIVLDVGANVGVFSLFAAKQGARVYACEPIPETFAALQKNVALHHLTDQIKPLNIGLCDSSATKIMHHYPRLTGFSSCQPRETAIMGLEAAGDALLPLMREVYPIRHWFSRRFRFLRRPIMHQVVVRSTASVEISCQFDTISGIIASENLAAIDLLKLDAECADWEVLKGISEDDWPKIRQIAMEVHVPSDLDPIAEFLLNHGFTNVAKNRCVGNEYVWARQRSSGITSLKAGNLGQDLRTSTTENSVKK